MGKNNNKLYLLRKEKGWSRAELSVRSGVNVRQIARVELGEAIAGNLTARNLLALADALEVDPHVFIQE